jgi:hypothetical protein
MAENCAVYEDDFFLETPCKGSETTTAALSANKQMQHDAFACAATPACCVCTAMESVL